MCPFCRAGLPPRTPVGDCVANPWLDFEPGGGAGESALRGSTRSDAASPGNPTEQHSTAAPASATSFVAPLLEVFVLLPLDFKTEVLDAHGDRARKTAASENGRHLGSWDRSPFSPRELQAPKHQNAKPAEIQPHKPGPERGTSMEARGVK